MFNGASIRFGSIAGIPLRVHASWLIALFLATTSLSVELASSAGRFALPIALVTALVLFASLIAHELGHALVARRCGVGVISITLFVFGGVATLDTEPRRPRDEFAIAIAGPIVSMLLGVVGLVIGYSGLLPKIASEPFAWLGRVNIGLAVFNLLPGFPLDGGRILRAILWAARREKDSWHATLSAAHVGRVIAYFLMTLGIARSMFGSFSDGLWIGFIGWFLLSAARGAVEQANLRAALGSTPVAEAMIRRFDTIPASMSCAALVQNVLALGGQRIHVVSDEANRIVGAVTLNHIFAVPRPLWERTRIADVLIPLAKLPMLDGQMPLLDAFGKIADAPLAFIREGDAIVGIVDQDRLTAVIGLHLQLMATATGAPTSTAAPKKGQPSTSTAAA